MFTVVVSFEKKDQLNAFIGTCQRMEFVDFVNELMREENDNVDLLDTTNVSVDVENNIVNFRSEVIDDSPIEESDDEEHELIEDLS